MVKTKFSGGSLDYFNNPHLNYTNYKSDYSGFNSSNKHLLNNLQNKNTLNLSDNGITDASQLVKNSISNKLHSLSKNLLGGADTENIVKRFTS